MSDVEPRILAAWQEWLNALGSDPEAAIAAAHVYGALSDEGRDAWLAALEEDGPKLGVPKVALYAPLLSVETDVERIERIRAGMGAEAPLTSTRHTTALRGVTKDASRVAVLVAPLYADFVQVLWCRYSTHVGFDWVRLDPIQRRAGTPMPGDRAEGVVLEATPLKIVVEELALAILAQRRRGHEIPSSMVGFANLFDAKIDADTGS
ncbi:MAG: hypothetical protein IPG04_16400 [Polyangiaceae bacterium]|nr:hypothetical protein [Polyangiaceae bacterium]